MPDTSITTDYLVVGAGAAGLAFTDALIAEDPDAEVTIVDRLGKPGGHWNHAYRFVTLHQPSAFYGVNSLELGSGLVDSAGLNEGLGELASGAEVVAYFDRVMQRRLLPSGRVRFFPLCNYMGDGRFDSLLSGSRTQATVRRKVVDSTYLAPSVPATHRRRFRVGAGATVVPPGALPDLWHGADEAGAPRRFVVVGAGKTAMDTCTWLLQSGADADAITWVVPRDAWLLDRATTQNAPQFFDATLRSQADMMQAFAEATSIDDLYLRLEACGALLRIDRARTPSMFHLATLTRREAELLRGIRDVVRLGRVQSVDAERMTLERGEVAVAPRSVFVDCTASAVEPRPLQPIFQDGRIVLQLVRVPQPTFSAAIIAYVEAHGGGDDARKNRLCAPAPFPHRLADYVRSMLVSMTNGAQWQQDEAMRRWVRGSRLDAFSKLIAAADRNDAGKQALIARFREQAGKAFANLSRLSAAHP